MTIQTTRDASPSMRPAYINTMVDDLASIDSRVDTLEAGGGGAGSTGPTGPTGATGATGAAGPGVAAGGTSGQLLAKNSNADYDTAWVDPAAGTGGGTLTVRDSAGGAALPNQPNIYFTGVGVTSTDASPYPDWTEIHFDNTFLPISMIADAYTLTLGDAGVVLECNGATTITIPPHSDVAFKPGTVIQLDNVGTGTVSVVAGAGVTLQSAGGLTTISAQYAGASLRRRFDDNTWILVGALT